ncbi:AAA family ATPase [Pseudoalteromonas sp. CF6-2]|uniref:AAA family ATPase n=1 Tax=unclassified Pseudoalteromonas TaxID=194690 RepID=UPI00187FFD2F|nr:AAA family ATPase [Lelliottia steviae]UJX25107.1 ATP-binding protein [Pseudoalteromonas sp. CF6-2]
MKKRIVLTGGPGGGKTTAIDLLRREFSNQIVVVPESATMLFSGGIERNDSPSLIKAQQQAIYNLQKHLEHIQRTKHPDRLMLCDRGSLDGLAYWPDNPDEFFKYLNTDLNTELAQYDAVIFFETAAKSGQSIHSNNPVRNESDNQAIILDDKLQAVWSQHPNFNLVKSSESFIQKVMFGINTIQDVMKGYQ